MHLSLSPRRGLNIPIDGAPKLFQPPSVSLPPPKRCALDLSPFLEVKPRILVEEGEEIKRGDPLVVDKALPERLFVAPLSGKLLEIQRGEKRRLLSLILERGEEEREEPCWDPFHIDQSSREELLKAFSQRGLLPYLRMRPLNLLAHPQQTPDAIFVKGVESAPFLPPPEWQVGKEREAFLEGLRALKKLTPGPLHLITDRESFQWAKEKGIERHTVSGPHPIGNLSLHIAVLHPKPSLEKPIWTIDCEGVLAVGKALSQGRIHKERVICCAGSGIAEKDRGYLRVHGGHPIQELLAGRELVEEVRILSGDPLMGREGKRGDFLGWGATALTLLPNRAKARPLHFLRLGFDRYSALRAYWSGHWKSKKKRYELTTQMHGEERAFIEGRIYDSVMPLPIPTMPLLKAVMAEDWELAERLGLLEVAPEDFSLASFLDPSKIEMVEIMERGLLTYAKETFF